ncbi:MAG: SEL1-like repeat protein, partial [Bacteroidota bacterium]
LVACVCFFFSLSLCNAQRKTRQRPTTIHSMIKESDVDYQLWEGFTLVQKANAGEPAAQHELGLRFLTGKGFSADTAKAVYWIKKSAEQEFLTARFNLGIFLLNGIGLDWNPFEAYRQFEAAAEKKLPEATYVQGLLLTENLVVPRDWLKAYQLIKEAADNDFAAAKKILKEFEKRGIHVDSMTTSASKVKSAKDSSTKKLRPIFLTFDVDTSSRADDSTIVADLMREGSSQLKKLFEAMRNQPDDLSARALTVKSLEEEADAGSPEALSYLGRLYEKGLNVKKDRFMAAECYLRALRAESPRAHELLWNLAHEQGFAQELERRGKSGDTQAQFIWSGLLAVQVENRLTPDQALGMLQSAAEKNYRQALIELGMCYQSGRWVKQDRAKAEDLWRQAAGLGSVEARIRLAALSVVRGERVEMNLAMLRQAMEDGSVIALVALGYCHEKGIGVARNKGEGARMYRDAVQRGSENAYAALRRMHDEIRPKEKKFEVEE